MRKVVRKTERQGKVFVLVCVFVIYKYTKA